jgi:hypothetical protein
MTVLRVMASRHSAFYSPLLGAIAGGFLQEEGFEPVMRRCRGRRWRSCSGARLM